MVSRTPQTLYKIGMLVGGDSVLALIGKHKVPIKGDDFSIEEGDNTDIRSYFGNKLKVFHRGPRIEQQTPGAALPAAPNLGKAALTYDPIQSMSWTQVDIRGQKMFHTEKRIPERSIFGEAANDALERGGVTPQPLSAWTHTRPDHLNFEQRLDKELRVPGYPGVNKTHTAFESAAEIFARTIGPLKVTRKLGEPVPRSNSLISELHLGFVLEGAGDTLHHFIHRQSYFANDGARHGDDMGIVKFLEEQQRRIENGLPTFADKVTKIGKAGYGDDVDEFDGEYASVADGYLNYIHNNKLRLIEANGEPEIGDDRMRTTTLQNALRSISQETIGSENNASAALGERSRTRGSGRAD